MTPAQKAVYDAICSYVREYGISPSTREIGEMLNYASTNTVHRHLKNLRKQGYITYSKRSCSIRVTACPTEAA